MIDLSVTAVKIANARKEKGFTQEELAARLGVSSQAVSKWERALSLPDIELLIDLSKILDMSLESLLANSSSDSPAGLHVNTTVYDIGNSALIDQILNDQMIFITIGTGLIPIFSNEFISKFSEIRKSVFQDAGVVIPAFRIMDDTCLSENQCTMTLFGTKAWSKEYTEPDDTTLADILENVAVIIKNRLSEFVNRHMVKLLVENLEIGMPFIVDGVIPERINLSTLRTLLRSLVEKGVSIRNLIRIIETIDDLIDEVNDTQALKDVLAERLAE